MSRLLKSVVLYLLLLALPAQGYAASVPRSCGAANQGENSAHRVAHESKHGHLNALGSNHHPHALSVEAANLIDSTASVDAADPANISYGLDGSGGAKKLRCSTCAFCCTGSAMPSSTLLLQPVIHSIGHLTDLAFNNIGFVTDGPRRPPRSLLA